MQPTHPPDPDTATLYRDMGFWQDMCLDELLRQCAREFPDRVAVIDRKRRASFGQLEERTRRLAASLADLGVGPGDVVSFQLPNWLEAVEVYQAVLRLGAVANPLIPIYRAREARFILRQARTKVLVIPASFRGFDYPAMYRELSPELPELAHVIAVGDRREGCLAYEDLASGAAPEGIEREKNPGDVSLLLYTSGTTADPKGALHSHNTLLYEARYIADWFRMNETDVIFNPSPVTHITGVLCALNIPFFLGCPVVLQDVWDADAALALIERERCTFMIFATPFLQGLTYAPRREQFDLGSIRYVVCGGADIPLSIMRDATDRLGCVVRQYGATEAPSTTCCTVRDPFEKRAGTDGRWMLPTHGKLLRDDGSPAAAGEVGEVVWRGPDMFLGYLDPRLNDDAFTPDGHFRTGDLAVMDDDGYLKVVGRKKDIINRGGEKISPAEIEDLLFRHPAVREAAVVAMPDEVMVEKGCAFVVPESGREFSFRDMTRHLEAAGLARQKFPERLEVVPELPRTASGKVQKFALRERLWQDRSRPR